MALKEFADELTGIPKHRIRFSLQATMNGNRRRVRISESAWPSAVSRLLRGEVIDIEVVEERMKGEKDEPPRYLEVPDIKVNDMSISDRDGRRSKSAPSSRQSSPSLEEKAEVETTNARTWFRRRT
jgi:hypothetical protein